MPTTLAQEPGSELYFGDLKRIQKIAVRVVIAVQDGDGKDLCRFAAGTDHLQSGSTVNNLFLKFVDQWANMHDAIIERVEAKKFGHLSPHDVQFMDVLSATGALMLSALKEIQKNGDHDSEIAKNVVNITHSLQALAMLQSSYESNLPNEELDLMSSEAR